jgi:hypothetical protein
LRRCISDKSLVRVSNDYVPDRRAAKRPDEI